MDTLSAREIAELILNKSDTSISHRKLQKLLYYSQAISLKIENKPIFSDKIEAWEHGPVCPKVYYKWKNFGYTSLPKIEINIEKYSLKTINIVLLVLAIFGSLSQDQLIDMTHIDSPWSNSYIQTLNVELKTEEIKDYFSTFTDSEDYLEYVKQREKYKSLVNSRKSYLQNLSDLGADWISPTSISPNQETINIASKILEQSKDILNRNRHLTVPKLILGPIPTGGIGIEFVKNNNKMYLNIHHNNLVELDIENDGFFTEYEENHKDIYYLYKKLFKEFV